MFHVFHANPNDRSVSAKLFDFHSHDHTLHLNSLRLLQGNFSDTEKIFESHEPAKGHACQNNTQTTQTHATQTLTHTHIPG